MSEEQYDMLSPHVRLNLKEVSIVEDLELRVRLAKQGSETPGTCPFRGYEVQGVRMEEGCAAQRRVGCYLSEGSKVGEVASCYQNCPTYKGVIAGLENPALRMRPVKREPIAVGPVESWHV